MKTLNTFLTGVLAFTLFAGASAWAVSNGRDFTVASENLPSLAPGVEGSAVLVRLKQQAVREFLQKILGPRYDRYDAMITPEFAERYITDYQVNRQSPDSTQMEIGGHLDTDSLKQWVRVNETKAAGNSSLKPLFLISANLPGFSIDPKQSAVQVKQNPATGTFFRQLSEVFQKFNAVLATSDETGLGLTKAPTRESEIRTLRSYGVMAGFNSAVWVNLSVCKNCGTRIDFILYNLTQARQVLSTSVDVEMDPAEMSDAKRLTKAISKAIADFAAGFEESISKGTLFAMEYRLIVEGLNTYKAFKLVDSALGKQDFILQSALSRAQSQTAEFRILSPLPPRELFQRFNVAGIPGLTLKPLSIDSQTVTVRYLN
jgi:hypothetical protein